MKFNYPLGAMTSAWLLAVLVIGAQLIPAFKNLLVAVFTHHWIGKAILITAAFVIAGLSDRKIAEKSAWHSVLGSLAAIGLFFVIEYIAL